MSLVSNFVGEISASQFGGKIFSPNHTDLNDTTFSDILNEKITGMDNSIMNTGGLNILDLQNNTQHINSASAESLSTNPINDMTTSEVLTFSHSLFDSSNTRNNPIYNFARKSATDFYGKYSKNIAMNLSEFVEDTIINK